MKGLCHKCFSSGVELTIKEGTPICNQCNGMKKEKEFSPCKRCKTKLCYDTKECLIQVMKVDKN